MKSFESQSLSLPNTDKDDTLNKAFDTKSLNPKILMALSTNSTKPGDTCSKAKYWQTIISESQVEVEPMQTEIECLAPYVDCNNSSSSVNLNNTDFTNPNKNYDCTSPYPQNYANIVRSKIISESQILEPPSNGNSRRSSGLLQNIDASFVDIPLDSKEHDSQIQIVPLNAFLHIPQDTKFMHDSKGGSSQNHVSYIGDRVHFPGIELQKPEYSPRKRMSESLAYDRKVDGQAKAPLIAEKGEMLKPQSAQQTPRGFRVSDSNMDLQINNVGKKDPNIDISSVTLYESCLSDDILKENVKSYKDTALNDQLLASVDQSDKPRHASQAKSGRLARKIFRIFNFLRAIAIGIYVFVNSSRQLQDEDIIALGARNLLIASIAFAALDFIVAFIRLFPKFLWCCWDVKNWDPIYTVWAIIANHALLIDVIPVVLNVIVRIYVYRMSEILSNPSIKDSIYNLTIEINQIDDVFRYQNLIILMCFAATLFYQVAFHASSVMLYLSWDKRAAILGFLVFLKSLLLLFDIIANGMLFYKVLVYKGIHLFDLSGLVAFTISIVAPSPLITLITNGLVNIPLHFSNFRMRLGSRSISWQRLLKAASKQTFHFLLIPGFLYLFYSSAVLVYILKEIRVIDSAVENLVPKSSFFGWKSGHDILLGMIWTNVVINYLGGMLLWILWLVFSVFW